MTMHKFRASDGLAIAYALDDYTDPWRTPETVILVHAVVLTLAQSVQGLGQGVTPVAALLGQKLAPTTTAANQRL